MLVYRALLIDTEQSYKRPVQQYFSDLQVAEDWATKTLAVASNSAYVQLYRAFEKECGKVLKPPPEVPDDKAQHRVFNRLRKKQVNKSDISVVEINPGSATFYVAYPGLYLTYAEDGKLLEVETLAERAMRGNRLAGSALTEGEMGSDKISFSEPDSTDDDVPF